MIDSILKFNFIFIFFFSLIDSYVLIEVNGLSDDLYGDVTPTEIISSLGSAWNFGPGYQDTHELFHIILSVLDSEMQPECRVCMSKGILL